MDKGFWGVVEEFLGKPEMVLRIPVAALQVHLGGGGFQLSGQHIEQLLLEDSSSPEPSLRWSVSRGADGKLVFTPR